MKYDIGTSESRRKTWEALSKHKASNERTIKIAKIKNPLVVLIFAFSCLVYAGYLADFFVRSMNFDDEHFGAIPYVRELISFAADAAKDNFIKTILFGLLFVVIFTAVSALVIRIVISVFIRKKKPLPAEFPEDEEGQMKAIAELDDEIDKINASYESPFGSIFGAAFINTLAVWICSAVILVREGAQLSVISWILFAGVGILACILQFILAFLSSMSFSSPVSSGFKEELEAYRKKLEEEKAEKERAERKAAEEAKARAEQERIDVMTGDELYEYASMLEDDDVKLRYLKIAKERGSELAPFLIDVIHKSREEERYKRSRAFMDAAWDAQARKDYKTAQRKFYDAAKLDNPDGMYNYARLCLKFGERTEAIRWLEKAIASGTYDDADTRSILAAVRRGDHINIVD